MRHRRILTIAASAAALGLVLFAAPAGATGPTVQPATPNAPTRPVAAAPPVATSPVTCTYTKVAPADRFKGLPPATANTRPFRVVLHTTQGEIVFAALTDKAPCTTSSFRFLAQHRFYDDTHCHRLVTQHIFVLQCGDPTGTGSGAPGYSFADENLAGATYPAGTVAMANAGPNTNGSQFFFTNEDTKLPPLYTPFGRVISGMDVLRKIAAGGEDDQNSAGDGYPNLFVGFRHVQIVNR